jgi:hypothetical protein
MKRILYTLLTLSCLSFVSLCSRTACSQSTAKALDEIRKIGTGDQEAAKASALALQLNRAKDLSLTQALLAMKGATPIGRNWLSGVANSRYRVEENQSKAELEKILQDTTQDGEARYKAFVWLTKGNDKLKSEWLPTLMEDPSPELRYASIDAQIPTTKEAAPLQKLLAAARHPDQVIDTFRIHQELESHRPFRSRRGQEL